MKTSHQLARELLEKPNLPIVISRDNSDHYEGRKPSYSSVDFRVVKAYLVDDELAFKSRPCRFEESGHDVILKDVLLVE